MHTSPSPAPSTAAELLAITDDAVLVESLMQLLPPGDPRFDEARRMVDALTRVQLYLGTSGIAQVLDVDDLMDDWSLVEAWWATLGAHRAAELAGAVASLFAGGSIPPAEQGRYDRIAVLMENCQHGRGFDDPWRGISVLRRLDFEYADASADVARAVRRLLEANRTDPAATLARVADEARAYVPPARPTEWAAYVDNGLDGAQQQAAWHARWKAAMEGVRTTGEVGRDAAVDTRVLRFLDDISRITPDEWSRVAGRRLALSAERKAVELALGMVRKRAPRELTSHGLDRLKASGATEPLARAAMITGALPRIGLVGDQRGPLEHWAIRAALQGLDAITWYDVLVQDSDGRRVLHVMLSPFEGYISAAIPRRE